jgi:chromosome segregation ATPase
MLTSQQEISDTGKKHLELQSRLTAAEIRNEALAAEVDRAAIAVSAMKADVATMEDNVRMTNDDAEERIREIQAACEDKISSVQEELHEAETTRRKLHNQVQELKGNIRVFARVRPPLGRSLCTSLANSSPRKGQPRGPRERHLRRRAAGARNWPEHYQGRVQDRERDGQGARAGERFYL